MSEKLLLKLMNMLLQLAAAKVGVLSELLLNWPASFVSVHYLNWLGRQAPQWVQISSEGAFIFLTSFFPKYLCNLVWKLFLKFCEEIIFLVIGKIIGLQSGICKIFEITITIFQTTRGQDFFWNINLLLEVPIRSNSILKQTKYNWKK